MAHYHNTNDIVFTTRSIYYEPESKNINILMQDSNGPCMLIAIVNTLVLRKDIQLKETNYSLKSIIEIIQNLCPEVPDLSNLINGFDINPLFSHCYKFNDYPNFLELLNINMYHALVCDPQSLIYDDISRYDYDSFEMKLLESSEKENSEEFRILNKWNNIIVRQATKYGIEEISRIMNDGEIGIYFRSNHFSVIIKYNSKIFSLITDSSFLNSEAVWESLPDEKGDSSFYDPFFMSISNNDENSTDPSALHENKKEQNSNDWFHILQQKVNDAYRKQQLESTKYTSTTNEDSDLDQSPLYENDHMISHKNNSGFYNKYWHDDWDDNDEKDTQEIIQRDPWVQNDSHSWGDPWMDTAW
ncbi:hypothetical protein TRFO_07430 [Tritrichomonas foetus]|uniref:MINDY deubiquitinase domain-containing protein n=1 Tax=Tritrichomonas foetus TaxID=1144522 RepID=A0A1J4JWE8_9EUKA|nr:hypothetical protein TRFO_07430 [Tritrichomonas foetus]|eukprot:OHT01852.1 hypothetical protein TRFO_07430 [Tritrichomonas foetus]